MPQVQKAVSDTAMYPRVLKLWLSIIFSISLIIIIRLVWEKGAMSKLKDCSNSSVENNTNEEYIKELGKNSMELKKFPKKCSTCPLFLFYFRESDFLLNNHK